MKHAPVTRSIRLDLTDLNYEVRYDYENNREVLILNVPLIDVPHETFELAFNEMEMDLVEKGIVYETLHDTLERLSIMRLVSARMIHGR